MSFSTDKIQGKRLMRSRDGTIRMTEGMAHPARSVILVFEGFHKVTAFFLWHDSANSFQDDSNVVVKLLDQIAKLVNHTSRGIWVHENLKRNHTDIHPDFKLAPNTDDTGERKRISDLIRRRLQTPLPLKSWRFGSLHLLLGEGSAGSPIFWPSYVVVEVGGLKAPAKSMLVFLRTSQNRSTTADQKQLTEVSECVHNKLASRLYKAGLKLVASPLARPLGLNLQSASTVYPNIIFGPPFPNQPTYLKNYPRHNIKMASTILFSPDESFNYEILRILGHSRYSGADVEEVLRAASSVEPGNVESFYSAFHKLAIRVKTQADAIDSTRNPISARDAYFRASTYFRSAGFYLNGHDPRITTLWDQQIASFDKAIALLPSPGERLLLKGDGFNIPAIFYSSPQAKANAKPRPTIIVGIGFNSGQEELLHAFGLAALERGYNVLTYDGPGQGSARIHQGLGFIHNWEKAVTPLVDYLVTRPEVDSARLALIGWSLGGYLSVRAAAFEPRLSAVLAIDGVYDAFPVFYNIVPPAVRAAYDAGDTGKVNSLIGDALTSKTSPAETKFRWAVEHGVWSFTASSAADFLKKTELMTLKGVIDRVKCPVLVGEAVDDMFFKGQPAQVAKELGDRATHLVLTAEDAASQHCHVGALSFVNHLFFDWLGDVFSRK
ncbi:hypothetical protein G7Y89_g3240 [Cudoniella acicularis]|uniref:AB hydrolase-1 domain-containing protein n=1 Tax=Cudoniella acicularis TaxID=354080 RepID=A0A8H4RT13_9HELO|nr:hypothetical protein G7Y89_g3240 [Cudoniella acicularis]